MRISDWSSDVCSSDLIADATLLIADGKIEAVGTALPVPEGYREVDGRGKWLTPGIIDAHSHPGVYPSPATPSHEDGNEAVSPNTAEVWAEHSVWPQDPKFRLARAGGVTSLMILDRKSTRLNSSH